MDGQLFNKFAFQVFPEHQLLYWRVVDKLELQEVSIIVPLIKVLVTELPTRKVKLLVDNRFMVDKEDDSKIVFPSPINEEWLKLQQWLLLYCSHVAVLCGSLLMKSQMERLASLSGLQPILRTYWDRDPELCFQQSLKFLNIHAGELSGLKSTLFSN